MKKLFILASILGVFALNGCGGSTQPNVQSGEVNDKTLNGNAVDFFTLLRVQNNYGTQITISDSDNGKVTK